MNKQPAITFLSISFLLLIIISVGCNKSSSSNTIPSILTYGVVSGVTTTTAQACAVVTDYAGGVLTANGVCWSSANPTPTIADTKTSNSVDTVTFIANLTGLIPNTTYYIRSYATNSAGTGYGNVVKFKTNSATYAATATVSTYSGSLTYGLTNGAVSTSQFYNPQGICTDLQGNMYVADSYNNVIRKITPGGITSTYAGNGTLGYVDGPAASAEFYAPAGVAADAQGNIYVSDMGNNIIRKISSTGVVSTLAGKGYAGYADGAGVDAVFKSPAGIAVDAQGNVYVADRGNNAIREISAAGIVTTMAGNPTPGQGDLTGILASFNSPTGVAVDTQGNVYVADQNNYAIREISPAGLVTTLVGNYLIKTTIPAPTGICRDSQGNLYITDASGRVLELSTGNILFSLAGNIGSSGFANGVNTNAIFNNPQALTVDASGNIYVADQYNNMIRKIAVAIQQ
jgi:sugar lactone lactonase YvrE